MKLISLCSVFIAFLLLSTSFKKAPTLKGSWRFCGGYFNGKLSAAPKDYVLQRNYTNATYEGFLLEKGEKPYKYEIGNYQLIADTCLETQTFSAQPSELIGITLRFVYTMRHDTLVLKVKLPNGNIEEDHWKRVK